MVGSRPEWQYTRCLCSQQAGVSIERHNECDITHANTCWCEQSVPAPFTACLHAVRTQRRLRRPQVRRPQGRASRSSRGTTPFRRRCRSRRPRLRSPRYPVRLCACWLTSSLPAARARDDLEALLHSSTVWVGCAGAGFVQSGPPLAPSPSARRAAGAQQEWHRSRAHEATGRRLPSCWDGR